MGATGEFISRDGTPLLIYNFNAGGERPLHGAYKVGEIWYPVAWTVNGTIKEDTEHNLDVDWDASDGN